MFVKRTINQFVAITSTKAVALFVTFRRVPNCTIFVDKLSMICFLSTASLVQAQISVGVVQC